MQNIELISFLFLPPHTASISFTFPYTIESCRPPSHPISTHTISIDQSILCSGSKTGQLILWNICEGEEGVGRLQPFMVLISEGSPIKIVEMGISKFGEEVCDASLLISCALGLSLLSGTLR